MLQQIKEAVSDGVDILTWVIITLVTMDVAKDTYTHITSMFGG